MFRMLVVAVVKYLQHKAELLRKAILQLQSFFKPNHYYLGYEYSAVLCAVFYSMP